MAAALAIPLTGCAATMGGGDAGCASYAEARLARPPAETVAEDLGDEPDDRLPRAPPTAYRP